VITESTADFAAVTHILCCSCGMYFSADPSSVNDHGNMNLASKTAAMASTRPSQGSRHPSQRRVFDVPLHVRDGLTGSFSGAAFATALQALPHQHR
jgi:hypothetical protein